MLDLKNIKFKPIEKIKSKLYKRKIPKILKTVDYPEINRYSIEETNDVVKFLLALGYSVSLAYEDKNLSITDAVYLIEPTKALLPAIIGLNKVPLELSDKITDEELGIIKNSVVESGVFHGSTKECAIEAIELSRHLKEFIYKWFIK